MKSVARRRIGLLISLVAIIAAATMGATWTNAWRVELALWLGLFVAGESLRIHLPEGGATMSMAPAPYFAGLLYLPPGEVLLLAAGAVACVELLIRPRPPERAVFNAAQTVLCLEAASLALRGAGIAMAAADGSWLHWSGAVVLGAAVFYGANRLLVAVAIAISDGRPVATVWRANFGSHGDWLCALALSAYGACVGSITGAWGLQALLGLVPVLALTRPFLHHLRGQRRGWTAGTPAGVRPPSGRWRPSP